MGEMGHSERRDVMPVGAIAFLRARRERRREKLVQSKRESERDKAGAAEGREGWPWGSWGISFLALWSQREGRKI